MTRWGRRSASERDSATIDGALAALDADELRKLMRDVRLDLDDRTQGRIFNELIDRVLFN